MKRLLHSVVWSFGFAFCVAVISPTGIAVAQEPAIAEGAPGNLLAPEIVGEDPTGAAPSSNDYNYRRGGQSAGSAADPYNRLFSQNEFFRLRGWVDGGLLGNTSNPASNFNGPYNATQVDNGQLNQLYMIVDRPMGDDFTLGGRADILYGTDYFLAQSLGFETHGSGSPRWNDSQFIGLALPQLYGELGTSDSSVRIGHFYTLVGYEGVQSPTNFFYSHSYSYMFAGPFTNWGAIGSQKFGNWHLQAGMVNGWNQLSGDQNHGAFLGNLKYTGENGDWWSSFAIITGQEQNNPANLPNVVNGYANRTRYSFLVSKNLGSRTEYVFHQWLGTQETGAPGGGTAKWYGIDQYVYYRLNENWRLGTRIEWFRDQEGTRVGLTQPSNPNKAPLPGSYASWTVGVNWLPVTNVMIRPELRWDSYTGSANPFDDGQRKYQLLLGLDAIVQF